MKYSHLFVLSICLYCSCSEKKKEAPQQAVQSPASTYSLVNVEKGGVATQVKLPAQLAAYQQVRIFPKVNGYVKDVLVDIGSKVNQGKLLMTLQAPELEQAVLLAKEKYSKCVAEYSIDKEHYQRLQEASKTAGAISPLDLSTIKAKMEADQSLCNSEKANWQMQQTMMEYLKVTAPFSGVITERNVSPGALISDAQKEKPMLELKQIDRLRLQVDIPENISQNLRLKDTVSFYVSAFQGKKMTGLVSRKSMNINEQFRSERIEVDVLNPDNLLSPGMYVDLVVYAAGNPSAMYVPATAVVASTERKYVITIRDGRTVKVDVTTGNQTASRVEIFGDVKVGEKVIGMANDEIKEGISIH